MNINTFIQEYNGLTPARKVQGLQNLFNELLDNVNIGGKEYDDLILDILDLVDMAEQNNYFSEEGLDL